MTLARTSPAATRCGTRFPLDCDEHHRGDGQVIVPHTALAQLVRLRPTTNLDAGPPLEAEMRWIEKRARYYRGYLADERGWFP